MTIKQLFFYSILFATVAVESKSIYMDASHAKSNEAENNPCNFQYAYSLLSHEEKTEINALKEQSLQATRVIHELGSKNIIAWIKHNPLSSAIAAAASAAAFYLASKDLREEGSYGWVTAIGAAWLTVDAALIGTFAAKSRNNAIDNFNTVNKQFSAVFERHPELRKCHFMFTYELMLETLTQEEKNN